MNMEHIEITQATYEELAQALAERCYHRDFLGGVLTVCQDECVDVTLSFTIVIHHDKRDGHITKITPVWWDCTTELDGEAVTNDFSFTELLNELFE